MTAAVAQCMLSVRLGERAGTCQAVWNPKWLKPPPSVVSVVPACVEVQPYLLQIRPLSFPSPHARARPFSVLPDAC